MHGLVERAANPPYILGNFPRIELVFECVDKPSNTAATGSSSKYEKIKLLKQMLDSGALTQQEFEQEKAKLLAEP